MIALEAREVGRIGTAVISPAHGPIALAVIRREAEPGAQVEVGEDGVRAPRWWSPRSERGLRRGCCS